MMNVDVGLSKKEAEYLKSRVDIKINSGINFEGFIQFHIEEESKPSSAIDFIEMVEECQDGNTVNVSTSSIVDASKSLAESAEKAKKEFSNLKNSFQDIDIGHG